MVIYQQLAHAWTQFFIGVLIDEISKVLGLRDVVDVGFQGKEILQVECHDLIPIIILNQSRTNIEVKKGLKWSWLAGINFDMRCIRSSVHFSKIKSQGRKTLRTSLWSCLIIQKMSKSSNNRSIVKYIVLAFLLIVANSISKQKKEKQNTIIEANHFFSATAKTAIYNIEKVESGKPLILLLKDTDSQSSRIKNTVAIKLESGQQTVECIFKKTTDLCVIPKVVEVSLKMNIECLGIPCSVTWIIYQPQAKNPDKKQPALNLYTLQQSTDHLLGQITCNDPAIKTFDKDVTVYSESLYKRSYVNNVIYLMFPTEKKGFAFVNIQQNSRGCSQISFYSVPDKISAGQLEIKDFIFKQSRAKYDFSQIPKSDFRIEASVSRLDRNTEIKSSITVTLFGTKKNKIEKISQQKIKAVSRSSVADFSIAYRKPSEEYQSLLLVFSTDSNIIMIVNSRLVVSEVHMVQLAEAVYFTLKKGEELNFKIEGDEDAEDEQKNYIVEKRQEEINITKTVCLSKTDCQFKITALEDTENMIYISNKDFNSTIINKDGKGMHEFQQIEFIKMNKKAHHHIRLGDNVYFKKDIKKGKAFQVTINSPNVIIYASSATKCDVPDDKCRERTGNFHHPFVYLPEQDGQFLINVEGLDNGQFQLTIIEENDQFIPLDDGVSFSYTMDSQQKKVNFKFTLKEKTDVSFNLIAPLNMLKLIVGNEDSSEPDDENSQQSSDGYIFFEKDQIKNMNFVISIVKTNEKSDFFTHFTLIATSSNVNLRLQPSVNYYQTLQADSYKDFVFQFDPSESYILSYYLFNLKDQDINIYMQLSENSKDWKDAQTIVISKEADYIGLKEYAEDLCELEGVQSCEIFIRITNKMAVQVDLTLNLLMRNAIIELKDGIWQAYPETYMTASSNFYFYPRHAKKNIFLYYHSVFTELKLSYRLWKYQKEDINPVEWPFPLKIDTKETVHSNYKSNNYIEIDHEQMKQKCWPNCVLLVSLYKENINTKDLAIGLIQNMEFKIMASNNQVELPEKQKLSFSLGKGQDKEILIDLKYLLEKNNIKFYTTSTIGLCNVRANVYAQSKSVCPTEDSQGDFVIFLGETEVSLEDIKLKIKEHGIEDDNSKYLCVGVHSESSCKMTIQYSGQTDGIKKIHADTFQQIKLEANEMKLFKIDGFMKQSAKITRTKGFPFVDIKKCESAEKLKQCEQSFRSASDKGKQIVVKTESFNEQPCGQCIFLFKFSTVEPSQVSFHLQSADGQIELKENVLMFDFLNQGETNKYLIHAGASQDTIINLHIQQGEVQATVSDLILFSDTKSNNDQNRVIHLVVKGKKEESRPNEPSMALINPYAMSNDFKIYHLMVKSKNSQKAASYTVTYSSGKRETYLQDGLLLDYGLQPSKQTTFYYVNENSTSHIFFTLTMKDASVLNKLSIKAYYFEDFSDKQTKKEFKLQKPQVNKKYPNPTLLFNLPNQSYFMLELTNPTSKQETVTVGINHQEVILLPFDHDYPFQLHKKEELNILVDVNIEGFLNVNIKKCDRSEPHFGYTFDYDSFIKGQFMYSAKLNEDPHFHYTIKANRIGTLYMNFKSTEFEDSLLSVEIEYSQSKNKEDKIKAGKRGTILYELVDEKNAKITVPVAECLGSSCKGVKYFYMSSTVEQDLYSQLICSSSYFAVTGVNRTETLKLQKIDEKQVNGSIVFNYPLKDSFSFLGVKAVSESGDEVYYTPVQIATLLGRWSKVDTMQKIMMIGIVLSAVCLLAIFVRQSARRGYRPLNQSQDY